MGLGLLLLLQNHPDRLALQNIDSWGNDILHFLFRNSTPHIEILPVDGSQNIVDGIPVNQQTGGEHLRNFVLGGCDRQSRQIRPVNQNIPGLLIGKLNGISQKSALVLIDGSVLLYLIYQGQQLLLGHLGAGLQMKNLRQQLLPAHKQNVQRQENPNQELHDRCR